MDDTSGVRQSITDTTQHTSQKREVNEQQGQSIPSHKITMPSISSTEAAIEAAIALTFTLQTLSPRSPFTTTPSQFVALHELATIFDRATIRPARPKRITAPVAERHPSPSTTPNQISLRQPTCVPLCTTHHFGPGSFHFPFYVLKL